MANKTPDEGGKKKKHGGSNKRQRPLQSLVRWTREEFARVAAKADKTGLAVAAFIRAATLGDAGPRAQRRPPVHKELLIRALALHGRYGNNMNQIAHSGNAGNPVDLPELRRALKEWWLIRDALYQALGKKPGAEP